MSTLSERKVGQNLDGFFLFANNGLDKILDGDHALDVLALVDNGQVTNSLAHHLLHAGLYGLVGPCCDNFGSQGSNLLHWRLFGRSAEQGNFGDVVTFRDNACVYFK